MIPNDTIYRTVVEDLTEVICRFTPDGALTFVNEVYCRFFCKPSEELLGQRWQPHALSDDIPVIQKKLSLLSPANPVVVIENRVYSGTGEVRWMQFINRAFYDDDGTLLETQAVGRDIDRMKRAEEQLLKLNNELEQRVAQRTALLTQTNELLHKEISERKEAEAIAVHSKSSLQKRGEELEEANSALRVLLRQRETDRRDLEEQVQLNIRQLITPFVHILKQQELSAEATACLHVIEKNLHNIITSFTARLSFGFHRLSHKEILVANLVKEGRQDKDIAAILTLSIDTVKAHRRNIRKKLGLTGEKTNLRSCLISLNSG